MNLRELVEEYERRMLSLPLASLVSSEHDEHRPGEADFQPMMLSPSVCGCNSCRIIRIKKLRAFRIPRTKCPSCGKLFVSLLYPVCEDCRGSATKGGESQ